MYEDNISNPSRAETVNEWSFVPTALCALHGMRWVNFSFTLLYISQMVHLFPGTVLQARRSWVLFPMESLGFFIDLILPDVLWPWDQISL